MRRLFTEPENIDPLILLHFIMKILQLKLIKFLDHYNLIIVRSAYSLSLSGGKPGQLSDVSATTLEKTINYIIHLIICGFLHFSLSPKERSRHTTCRMERAWLYQFVDFRRGQRPNHNLTFIHPHNVSSFMEYCHAHDRS